MSVHRFFVLTLCLLVVLGTIGCGGKTDTAKQATDKPADTAVTQVSRDSSVMEPAGKNAAVAPSSRDSVVIELVGRDLVNVFDLLRESHAVCFQPSMNGVFVKQIDSVKSGMSAFWIYSVNDTMPNMAADRVMTHAGDRVKWYFRKMRE